MMKRFLALLLAMLMLLVMASACSTDENGEESNGEEGNETVENNGEATGDEDVIKIGVFEQNKVAVSHGQAANRYLRFRFVHMPSTSKIKVMIPVMTIIQTMAVTTACVVALPTLSALRPQ